MFKRIGLIFGLVEFPLSVFFFFFLMWLCPNTCLCRQKWNVRSHSFFGHTKRQAEISVHFIIVPKTSVPSGFNNELQILYFKLQKINLLFYLDKSAKGGYFISTFGELWAVLWCSCFVFLVGLRHTAVLLFPFLREEQRCDFRGVSFLSKCRLVKLKCSSKTFEINVRRSLNNCSLYQTIVFIVLHFESWA